MVPRINAPFMGRFFVGEIMNIKEKLLKYFEKLKKEISIKELMNILNINKNEYEFFSNALFELEKEGKILCTDNKKYIHVPDNFYLKFGKIEVSSKGNYYVSLDKGVKIIISKNNLNGAKKGDFVYLETEKSTKNNKQLIGNVVRVVSKLNVERSEFASNVKLNKDYKKNYHYITYDNNVIYIPNHDLNSAYIDDIVTVKIISNDNAKYGKVVKIEKRHPRNHIFEYKTINGNMKWIPLDTYPYDITINGAEKEDFKEGDKIFCKVSENNEIEYLGRVKNDNTLNSNISNLIKIYGFNTEFSEGILKECKSISKLITQEEINDRVDLRNLTTITIDGETAKDLDDSISLKKLDDRYRLYVHIADVSYYVNYKSKTFEEALNRTTSIYPPNGVIPMLPNILSDIVCSLNENEDKLTKTFMVDVDFNGNILDYQIFNSIIKSDKRMTYDKVNKVLDNVEIDDEYVPYINLLHDLNDLSSILQSRRINRGFIGFDIAEKEFNIDASGTIHSIHDRDKGKSQLIIENCMLLANEVATMFIYYFGLMLVYRNHEAPTYQQLSKLKSKLKEYKHYINTINNADNPKILQKILLTLTEGKSEEERQFLSSLMLTSMNRAYYSTNNIGHYALALDKYATFTSPIRRLSDLINHHVLSCILDGRIDEIDNILEDFETTCLNCSMKQELVEQFERDVELLLITDYMKEYYEKEMPAKILFVNNDKVYVRTYNGFYGNVKIQKNSIKKGNIIIDGKKYKIGDTLPVMIKYVKEKNNEIRFLPASEKVKMLKKGGK